MYACLPAIPLPITHSYPNLRSSSLNSIIILQPQHTHWHSGEEKSPSNKIKVLDLYWRSGFTILSDFLPYQDISVTSNVTSNV